MKSFFVFLSRNKLYTFINIFGLSVSLMFVILIATYITKSLTTDSGVEKADRIYVIATENYIGTGFWNGKKLQERYPEIENSCTVVLFGDYAVSVGNNSFSAVPLFADTTFFSMFSVKMIEGDPHNALADKQNVVLSREFANKVFGTTSPLGQQIKIERLQKTYTVSGIVENMKNSIFPDFDILTHAENVGLSNRSITDEHMSNAAASKVFLLAKPGTDLIARTNDILEYFKTYFWIYRGGAWKEVLLVPFKDIYFSHLKSDMINQGNWSFVVILMSVGAIILLFAVLNYINLTTAQMGFRAKEMAMRRLIGSSRSALFANLIKEALVMCAMAFVLGLMLAKMVEPYANELLQTKIDVTASIGWERALVYMAGVLALSLLAGVIPAYAISNFKPIEVVRGTFKRRTKMVYSKVLIAFQNVITIALIGGAITMIWQVRHLTNAPMGYNTKNMVNISVWGVCNSWSEMLALSNTLKQQPCVEALSMTQGAPWDGGNNYTISYGKDKMLSFQVFKSDSTFFTILGLQMKHDNHPAKREWYYTEETFRQLEVPEDSKEFKIGKDLEDTYTVGGVYHDFTLRSKLSEPHPTMLLNFGSFETQNRDSVQIMPWQFIVKVKGDERAAFNQIKAATLAQTGAPTFTGKLVTDIIKKMYEQENRTARIVLIFTIIAIIISSLGLLAISTYYVQQHRRDIAINRVFGATPANVLVQITLGFMKIIGVAFVVAVPIIWYIMSQWLNGFSYRIALTPLIFVLVGIVAALIAFGMVYWQTSRAAKENPVKALQR